MCGICGLYNFSGQSTDPGIVQRMTTTLCHRGPDDQGYYTEGAIALGMTRLAIIDLSQSAHQPMSNKDRKVWIVYNGETYNHRELRKDLEKKGYRYHSYSDSETVLHLYEEYGESCVNYMRGMYAFAIWDSEKRKFFIAVDRLGIKPIYYAEIGNTFLFASELKAILQYPAVSREVDIASLDEYFRYCYIPASRTIFMNIRRLQPAHCITVRNGNVSIRRYWELQFKPDYARSEQEWIGETRDLLRQCVQDELESDVPLGALLSGGIDSSAVVAYMSEGNDHPVRTFTIGFSSNERDYGHYDETTYARMVAQKFCTDHEEKVVKPEVLDVLPRIIWHFDEPFANDAAIPTWYLCQMARRYVKVALAGAGGDENFGGYPRYIGARFLSAYFTLPEMLREGFLKRLAMALPQSVDGYFILNRLKRFLLGVKNDSLTTYCNWTSFIRDDMQLSLFSPAVREELAQLPKHTKMSELLAEAPGSELLNQIFYADIKTYLQDNILTYSDRMASAHSLEMRVPLCDHRLVEFAATIPPVMKLKGFSMKYILKKAMGDILPRKVLYRRKQGFSVPMGYWLRDELLPLAKALLSAKKIEQRGYFYAPSVQNMLNQHLSGKADYSAQLWALMIFEVWQMLYIDMCVDREPDFSLQDLLN